MSGDCCFRYEKCLSKGRKMNLNRSLVTRSVAAALAAFCMLSLAPAFLFAARPTAARLLPEKTVFMVSVPNVQDLAQKFMITNLGQMTQDPQMKPFIETLYGSLGELVASASDRFPLSLSEILALPRGEITFALVEPTEEGPGFVFVFEAGDQIANAKKLLDNILRNLKLNREETIGEVKCSIYDNRGPDRFLVVFEKDAAIAICTKIEAAKQVLDVWNEKKDARSLAENANYGAIASRCRGSKDEEPQFIWYVDPVGFMKKMAETSPTMQIAVAMLPALGLDGLGGLGGSILFDTEQYDMMLHLHILLTSPRTGVFKAIAFEPGATKPERWVPGDIASYITFHWNFPTSLKAIETLFDSFRGDGAFGATLQNFGGRIDVDLQKQIVPSLDGRVTFLRWVEKPAVSLQSAHSLLALKLKDQEKDGDSIQKVLDGIAKKFPDSISTQTSAGKSYYCVNVPVGPDFANARELPRRPQPCFGIVEDYLVISDHPGIYERVLATAADSSKSLGGELDFKLISSKLQRIVGETKPAMLSFDRPEEGMRFLYDLATSDRTKERLQQGGSLLIKSINSSMQKQPLPPFSVLQKYLAPGGSLVIDDETGIHLMNFTLKRKAE
jgi:hypothetical protein